MKRPHGASKAEMITVYIFTGKSDVSTSTSFWCLGSVHSAVCLEKLGGPESVYISNSPSGRAFTNSAFT